MCLSFWPLWKKKAEDLYREGAGHFTVDDICLAVVNSCHLPGLHKWVEPEVNAAIHFLLKNDQQLSSFSQNYALSLLMLT